MEPTEMESDHHSPSECGLTVTKGNEVKTAVNYTKSRM